MLELVRRFVDGTSATSQLDHLRSDVCSSESGLGDDGESGLGNGSDGNGNGVVVGIQGVSEATTEDGTTKVMA